jgi:aryl-alcohol dehydrogenase-like predicted oxidoreductase
MQTRRIDGTGYEVSCIGLGGMALSIQGRPSTEDALRVIHAALDAGITFIDTADVYCLDDNDIGHNERLIARALYAWRGGPVVVATKGGLDRPGGAWVRNGHPKHIRKACEASLRALDTEAIDLYQLHAPDERIPFADTVGALADLRSQGKVRHVGLSNVTVAQILEARRIVPVASVQNRCSPFDRRPWEDGVLAFCEKHGIAFLPYSPVGGGYGKTRTANDATLNAVAKRHGATPYQVALAWLLAKSPAIIPIPGAGRVESAVSSARSADVTLDDADLAELNHAFPT